MPSKKKKDGARRVFKDSFVKKAVREYDQAVKTGEGSLVLERYDLCHSNITRFRKKLESEGLYQTPKAKGHAGVFRKAPKPEVVQTDAPKCCAATHRTRVVDGLSPSEPQKAAVEKVINAAPTKDLSLSQIQKDIAVLHASTRRLRNERDAATKRIDEELNANRKLAESKIEAARAILLG